MKGSCGVCFGLHRFYFGVLFALILSTIASFMFVDLVFADCSISLSTSGNVEMVFSSGEVGVAVNNVVVKNSCVNGYSLYISGPVDSNLYMNGDSSESYIGVSAGTRETPASLLGGNINTYGYSLGSVSGGSNAFIGLTSQQTILTSTNTVSANGGDTYSVTYGASADYSRPAGNYTMANSGVITYYLVAHPVVTITFDANGGVIPSGNDWQGSGNTATKDIIGNTYGVLPIPTRNGYIFLGWSETDITYENVDEHTVFVDASQNAGQNSHTVYAVWQPILPTMVRVDGNTSQWTTLSVTLTAVPSFVSNDNEFSFDGGTTWQSSNTMTFNANQSGVLVMVRNRYNQIASSGISSDVTKIDKIAPDITINGGDMIVTLGDSNTFTSLATASDSISGLDANGLVVTRNNSTITNTNIFTYPGLYAVNLTATDNAGNETSIDTSVLVRWPTGGRYVVKRTELDGADIAGEGLSLSSSTDGLWKDTAATGANVALPFASKYYYTGTTVDNYISFGGTTFRILNISTNDSIKVLGGVSDLKLAWQSSRIYDSNTYNTWSTKWWPRGQIYNREDDESRYKLFTETEKAHMALATFYVGRLANNSDDISYIVYNEQTNAIDLGGDGSPSFEGYSAYPNVSDFMKASKAHDSINSLSAIDTTSVYSTRQTFKNNSWIDMDTEYWTMNGRTGTLLQDNNFWVIDNDLGGHFEARTYSTPQQYRVVFYITDTTILSGDGSSSNPYTVEEDWDWFDDVQVLQ